MSTTIQSDEAPAESRASRDISPRRVATALVTLVAAGAALRVYQLPNESAWWDEIVTLRQLDAPSLGEFISAVRRDDPAMTPVYASTAYAWARAVSPSVLSLRVLSILFALGAFPLVFALARRLFDPRAGLIATLAFALSLVHIYFAQEVRVYALVVFFALVSVYTLVLALRTHHAGWWALHFTANAVLIFTHLFTTILFGVEAIVMLLAVRSNRRTLAVWLAAHVLLAIGLYVWLRTADMGTIDREASWMVRPGWREVVMAFTVFAGGRPSNENPALHLPTGFSLDIPLAALVYVVIAWFVIAKSREYIRTRNGKTFLPTFGLVVGLVAPLCVLAVASYVWRPCFVYRYVLFSSLPVCVLFGAGLSAIGSFRVRMAVLAAFLALSIHQLTAIGAGPFRADWRAAGQHIASQLSDADHVVVFQCFNRTALLFNSELPPNQTECVEVWTQACDLIDHRLSPGGAVWFPVWLWTPPDNFEACFRERGFDVEWTDFEGWPNVRIYRLARRQL